MRIERTPFRDKLVGGAAVVVALGLVIDSAVDEQQTLWHSSGDHKPHISGPIKPENSSTQVPKFEQDDWDDADYVTRGTAMRRRIKLVDESDPQHADELREKYQQLMQQNGGRQYMDGGEIFSPKEGDTYFIDDPSITRPGIYLREEARSYIDLDVDVATLFDGATVTITGPSQPVEVKPLFEEPVTEMYWPVEVVDDSFDFRVDSEAKAGDTGFISEKFLGNKLATR